MSSLSRQIEEKGQGRILRVQPVVLLECDKAAMWLNLGVFMYL